ncbi:MAG: prephenate dehydrogenase/arogenate dehydrogenase family protein [Planctomycetaceae bacterium]|nr:prephenate dehydrogenase/arogenate dehydrogenase family protein [Planctomycetaceae bacterium]
MQNQNAPFEQQVIVVGVGLIGGSVAAAVRKRIPDCAVIGIGRSEQRLREAQRNGLLTDWRTELTSDLLTSSVVVNCLPVNMIGPSVVETAALASDDVLITDAGSVKASICDQVQSDPRAARLFVPAHPIAGGEQSGFEFADADLFCGRVCVVVETSETDRVARAERFWNSLGARIVRMSAAEHDRVLALTSHLPHVIAAVTAATVGSENLDLTGSGFRDTTRIAAGSASLWTAILSGNRSQVVAALQAAETELRRFREALAAGHDTQVQQLLATAAQIRSTVD